MRDILTLASGPHTIDLLDFVSPRRTVALTGAQGWGFPTVSANWFEGAGPGGVFRGQREGFRDISLPLLCEGMSDDSIQSSLALLSLVLHPRTGPARLTYGSSQGETWWLDVVRAQGGDWTWGADGDAVVIVLTLRAGDPFWTRTRPEVFRIETGEDRYLLSPSSLAELTLGSAIAFGTQTLNNPGTVDAWPAWSAIGPLNTLTLVGPEGQTIRWEGGLAAGETLQIATTPPQISVNGVNRYQDLAPAPWFWSIPPGLSHVSVEAEGAGPGTVVECLWWPRTEVLF